MTNMPETRPVRTATFASGQSRHQWRIIDGSIVASFNPELTRGCFPCLEQSGLPHEQNPFSVMLCAGKTCQPMAAYRSATFRRWFPPVLRSHGRITRDIYDNRLCRVTGREVCVHQSPRGRKRCPAPRGRREAQNPLVGWYEV